MKSSEEKIEDAFSIQAIESARMEEKGYESRVDVKKQKHLE